MKLESFLVMPIQRLPRYVLLLKVPPFSFLCSLLIPKYQELRKYTQESHPDYKFIASAIGELERVTKVFNEVQREKESTEKITELQTSVLGVTEVLACCGVM